MIRYILNDNLELFLTLAWGAAGTAVDDFDRDAIIYGLKGTDEADGRWLEYPILNDLVLRFATSGDLKIAIDIPAGTDAAGRIDCIARILERYKPSPDTGPLEILIQEAFPAAPPPPGRVTSCEPGHLAGCTECQEVQEMFQDRPWTEVVAPGQTRLSQGYGGMCFLNDAAKEYYFPVYLVAALRDSDSEWLEIANHALGRPLALNQMQEESVRFVRFVNSVHI